MSIEIKVYETSGGRRPFDEWFDDLPATHAAKIAAAVTRIGNGNRSNFKPVGQGVSEWRIDWGPGMRIYVGFDGLKLIILLGGGTKSVQQSDIAQAIERWNDYKQRK